MILYKSIASVKDYREYLKDRMKQARDSSRAKARVSTINKKYRSGRMSMNLSNNGSQSRKDLDHSQYNKSINSGKNLASSRLTTNTRSQKILELENFLASNSASTYHYSRPA